MENIVEKIDDYYKTWNLRLSPSKCETILFRKLVENITSKAKVGYKNFQINITIPGTNIKEAVPHKKVVKYLGVQIDYLLRENKHIDTQLAKVRAAFKANSSIFYNKHLTNRAKTILYTLLIRPIITYASPIL